MTEVPAAADCELIGDSFWGQPVNSISSLAFVVVGLWLVRRRPVLGWAAIGVGVGSFLFHGPMPDWAKWAHDVSLAVVPVAIALEAKPKLVAAASLALGVLFGVWPGVAEIVTAVLVVEAGVLVLARRNELRSGPALLAVALLAAGVLVAALSRSDGPLCDPDSVIMGHAIWHLLGAAALWVWARAAGKPGPAIG